MHAHKIINHTNADKWKTASDAMMALKGALRVVGNGWWPHANRHSDINTVIEAAHQLFQGLNALLYIVKGVSSRAYDTSLTEYHLEIMFGFDAAPFVTLYELANTVSEQADDVIATCKPLLNALYDADDDEPEWWIPINVAADQATLTTIALLKDAKIFRDQLNKASEQGLEFFN